MISYAMISMNSIPTGYSKEPDESEVYVDNLVGSEHITMIGGLI